MSQSQTLARAPGVLSPVAQWARETLLAWRQRRRLRSLLDLDDRLLDDIGTFRGEVEMATGLDLRVNAALALRDMARERRLRKM